MVRLLSLIDKLEVIPGNLSDYLKLAEYHYLPTKLRKFTQIFKVSPIYKYHKTLPDPIAVNVYALPMPDIRGRTAATSGFFHTPANRSDRMKLVNKYIRYAARLIVDPRFRKRGIADWLLKESHERLDIPIIEAITPIDFTNDLLKRHGFQLHYVAAPTFYRRFNNVICNLGLTPDLTLLPSVLHGRIESLPPDSREQFERSLLDFMYHFRHKRFMPPGLDRAKFILSKIPYPHAYSIWFNPKHRILGLKRGDPSHKV